MRQRLSHIFEPDPLGHYPEPPWVSARLFEVEDFGAKGALVYDPCAGWGRIPHAAARAGYTAIGSDIVDRRYDSNHCHNDFHFFVADFLKSPPSIRSPWSAVFNPPYSESHIQNFVERALAIVHYKVAALVPLRRLPAAHWLQDQPLETIHMLTPRPSLPPASYIRAGNKPSGGGQDFAWLVFNVQATIHGAPRVKWLHEEIAA
jgi:hypothetical protein